MNKTTGDTNTFTWVKAIILIIMFVGLLISIYERIWFNVFLVSLLLLLTLTPTILYKRYKFVIPPEIEIIAIIFIFASGYLGDIREYYDKYWWWDKVLHFSSGILLGIVGFLIVYILNKIKRFMIYMKPAFVALFSFTFAVSIGAIWEIYEFAMDKFFDLGMQSHKLYSDLEDTMWDIILDTLGAAIISILGYFYMSRNKEFFINDLLTNFIEHNPKLFKKRKSKPST
ncbi:MAG: hypothetical protein HND52_11870 [Ignavibacteriae bacterium]|nr:hypothetical protein [Ignavibacteriota bacterium]NOG98648.1 hypothetical protein [Ignavibacteriota bacterium]